MKSRHGFKIRIGNLCGIFLLQIENKDPKQIEALHDKIREFIR